MQLTNYTHEAEWTVILSFVTISLLKIGMTVACFQSSEITALHNDFLTADRKDS